MNPINPLPSAATPSASVSATAPSPAARRQAAREFEGQVLGALLQPMFSGTETGGAFGGGAAEAQWRPMLVDEIARALARAGGLGLADAVLRDLTPVRRP